MKKRFIFLLSCYIRVFKTVERERGISFKSIQLSIKGRGDKISGIRFVEKKHGNSKVN